MSPPQKYSRFSFGLRSTAALCLLWLATQSTQTWLLLDLRMARFSSGISTTSPPSSPQGQSHLCVYAPAWGGGVLRLCVCPCACPCACACVCVCVCPHLQHHSHMRAHSSPITPQPADDVAVALWSPHVTSILATAAVTGRCHTWDLRSGLSCVSVCACLSVCLSLPLSLCLSVVVWLMPLLAHITPSASPVCACTNFHLCYVLCSPLCPSPSPLPSPTSRPPLCCRWPTRANRASRAAAKIACGNGFEIQAAAWHPKQVCYRQSGLVTTKRGHANSCQLATRPRPLPLPPPPKPLSVCLRVCVSVSPDLSRPRPACLPLTLWCRELRLL